MPDSCHDSRELIDGSLRSIDVGWSQARTEQKLAAENVQRQVAVVSVVAMKEAAFLVAVQWVIRCIEIEFDLVWILVMGIQEVLDQ